MQDIVSLRLGHDLRQSPAYGRYMQALGWTTVRVQDSHGLVQVFTRRLGPLLFAKIRRAPPNTPWPVLQKSLKSLKPLITQIDPEAVAPSELKKYGLHRKLDQTLGTKTLLIDLRCTSEQIMSSFKPETRLKLRKLLRFTYQPIFNHFNEFYQILQTGLSEIGVWCPPKNEYDAFYTSFGQDCFCLTVDGQSGCLVVIHDQVAEYYYAGSTREGKSKNLPYLVAWLAMLEAKRRGALVWDFNGLIDPRWPDKRWGGFSFFKTRFGGTELSFSGTYIKYGWW